LLRPAISSPIKAVGDDGKVTPIEWSMLGKRLGVFDKVGTVSK